MMFSGLKCGAAYALLCSSVQALAEAVPVPSQPAPAAGVELSFSTDSDQTDVVKLLGRALWRFDGRDSFQGIAIERALFTPLGGRTRKQTRAPAAAGGTAGQLLAFQLGV